jgi:cytochrome c oxidase subunit 2
VKFRKRKNDDGREPAQVYGSNQVEVAWTVIPILIVVALFMATARVIADIQKTSPSANAIEVVAIGHQFWWEYRYPGLHVVTANELHVPVSDPQHPTPTFIKLLSADTDHSFWVPRLAGKTDLIPNHPNNMWIDPHEAGVYLGQCAQYCGTQHAKMLLRVYVEPRDEFDRWIQLQRQPASHKRCCFRRTTCVRDYCLHQLSCRVGHSCQWALRPRSHPLDEPGNDRCGSSSEHSRKSSPLDSKARRHQAWIFNARH